MATMLRAMEDSPAAAIAGIAAMVCFAAWPLFRARWTILMAYLGPRGSVGQQLDVEAARLGGLPDVTNITFDPSAVDAYPGAPFLSFSPRYHEIHQLSHR